MARIEPEHLFKTKFLVMHPTEGQNRTVAFIHGRYRRLFHWGNFSLPQVVQSLMRRRGIS
uniref:Uncharacterized protein n=1 Tax=Hyaloperonospora arabidopsidis (strain Emoy2) TaxID=559515 RepID=M4B7M2_HYAAE